MIDYLRSTSDEVQKADVVKRLSELAERFAPDTQWFIDIMNQARYVSFVAVSPRSSAEKDSGGSQMRHDLATLHGTSRRAWCIQIIKKQACGAVSAVLLIGSERHG